MSEKNIIRVILSVAIIGAVYFGYHAINDARDTSPENPFEYNIDHFKKSDTSLHHYLESAQISLPENNWRGIAVDKSGRIFIAGNNKFRIYSTRTAYEDHIINGNGMCIAVAENGDCYIGLGDKINVYDMGGRLKSEIKLSGKRPLTTSLTLSSDHLYVADAGGHIVWQMDKTGSIIQKIGQKDPSRDIPGFVIPSPFFDVAIDPDNFLWVVNPGRHSLENYMADGSLRSSWGFYSMELAGFCGCCNPTHIAILSDGSFVTSEKGIARVKVYNRLGKLISVVAAPTEFKEGTEGLDLAVDTQQQIYILDPGRNQIRIFVKKAGAQQDV